MKLLCLEKLGSKHLIYAKQVFQLNSELGNLLSSSFVKATCCRVLKSNDNYCKTTNKNEILRTEVFVTKGEKNELTFLTLRGL